MSCILHHIVFNHNLVVFHAFQFLKMNTGLEYILGGGPIEEFNSLQLPTAGDVLRFYSKFWRLNETDTAKEARVATALINSYRRRSIETLNYRTVQVKIRKAVCSLKQVLKFKSKEKTRSNLQIEGAFKSELLKEFQVRKSISTESPNTATPMETDETVSSAMPGA